MSSSSSSSSSSSTLGSQCLVLATAMAVSAGTIILFDLVRDKYFPATDHFSRDNQDFSSHSRIPRSCLSSGDKKGKKDKKKTKKVQFAADVKEPSGNGEVYRREHRKSARVQTSCCGTEVFDPPALPANRAALYNGILKDRLQRTAYSY